MSTRTFLIFILLLAPAAVFAQERGFVPLTNIQNVQFAGNAASLPAFLNSIYMICIGLAAVIGVLQIMRAGVTWMTAAGSHEAIGNAKNLITQTIIGLILVLAPTIVFSIINPDILSLKIGNLEKLAPGASQSPADPAATTLWSDTSSSRDDARARCQAQGGQTVFTCTDPTTNKARVVGAGEACAPGEDGITICRVTENTDIGSCSDYARIVGPLPAGTICDATKGFTQINAKACRNDSSGSIYCGSLYSTEKPPKAPGCSVAYGNKADLKFDQTAELCCNTQDAFGISCEAQKVSSGGMTSGLMCVCTYNSATE